MNKTDAKAIVGNVWTGTYRADERLPEALKAAGISRAEFNRLLAEAHRVEVRHPRRVILIAAGTSR